MKLALTISAVIVSGCATTHAPARTADTVRAQGPEMVGEFQVHRVGHLARLAADAGGKTEAGVRVCVVPTGAVDSAEVTQSSGSELFDAALSSAVSSTRYRPFRAPDGTRVCREMRLVISEG